MTVNDDRRLRGLPLLEGPARDPLAPPYASLQAALEAREKLVSLFGSVVVAAALDTIEDDDDVDLGMLTMHQTPSPIAVRAQRAFARNLVERLLLGGDDLVMYPVTEHPIDDEDDIRS